VVFQSQIGRIVKFSHEKKIEKRTKLNIRKEGRTRLTNGHLTVWGCRSEIRRGEKQGTKTVLFGWNYWILRQGQSSLEGNNKGEVG